MPNTTTLSRFQIPQLEQLSLGKEMVTDVGEGREENGPGAMEISVELFQLD